MHKGESLSSSPEGSSSKVSFQAILSQFTAVF